MKKELKTVLGLTRIALGFVFWWAFVDKTFGLGFATAADKAWLAGVSPTMGYLAHGTGGPLGEVFAGMAGSAIVDGLFMLGMLGVGSALMLGMGMRVATVSGSLLMGLIYMSAIPPENNPLVDEHVIYILVLLVLYWADAGEYWGLGKWWKRTELVRRWPVLA